MKAFSALMLDIRHMSNKYKLFTFMESLKSWVHLELQHQWVTNLGSTIAAAERLTDFNPETGGKGRQCLTLHKISREGRNCSGLIPTEVGETENPTHRVVHKAV
ncbi:UNVERIFIED_CONTAM: hypothetical protein Slati_0516100 [Sesamum latifolium]|uniref:Uncharacterized protein n=1 Tax=Sesamum latifolium TaxID=2727402 RepID=A0AAW2XXX8_9LAMI